VKNDLAHIETVIAGCFVALLSALGSDANQRALDTLSTLAADPRTGQYEAQFYRDLFESIESIVELRTQPPAWGVFAQLETLH
jgi:hypothetical protein